MAIRKWVEILDLRNPVKRRQSFALALKTAESILERDVRVQLADCQQQALLSLVADLVSSAAHGNGVRFESSDLLKHLNNGELQLAAAEFSRFVYVGRKVDPLLWRKRDEEKMLFVRGMIPS